MKAIICCTVVVITIVALACAIGVVLFANAGDVVHYCDE